MRVTKTSPMIASLWMGRAHSVIEIDYALRASEWTDLPPGSSDLLKGPTAHNKFTYTRVQHSLSLRPGCRDKRAQMKQNLPETCVRTYASARLCLPSRICDFRYRELDASSRKYKYELQWDDASFKAAAWSDCFTLVFRANTAVFKPERACVYGYIWRCLSARGCVYRVCVRGLFFRRASAEVLCYSD